MGIVDGGRAYRCARCKETKPLTLEHFYVDAMGKVTGYCKPCHAAWWREYMAVKQPDYRASRRDYMRAWHRRKYGVTPDQFRGKYRDEAAS